MSTHIRKVSPKYQVAIPLDFVREVGFAQYGSVQIEITADKDSIVIRPAQDPIERLSGILKNNKCKSASKHMQDIRAEEIEQEDKI